MLTQREEIDVIYEKYAQTDKQMSAADVLKFLQAEQRENVTTGDALRLIEKYEMDPIGRDMCVCLYFSVLFKLDTSHHTDHVCLSSAHQQSRVNALPKMAS